MNRERPRIDKDRAVLLVLDMQPDFLPGGALPVPGADAIVSPLSELMSSGCFDLIVAAQDWHPREHVSFASNHPGRMPMETIELYGHTQTLWPDHCIQGTPGAALHPDLPGKEPLQLSERPPIQELILTARFVTTGMHRATDHRRD